MVFVVFEGLDASGKSTQARGLKEFLSARGRTVYLRFHPSDDCWSGVMARRFLLSQGRSAHFAAAMFYILDVLRSVVASPWWLYDYVVFVRYLMGTAYLPSPLDRFAYHFFEALLPRPHRTFFLEVDPEEAYRRVVDGREEQEMFETPEQLRKIGGKALELAQLNGWTVVDANQSEEEVGSRIRAYFT